jgi:hypothetical protein
MIVRMGAAQASEAGRQLARARWGDQHVRRLVDELAQRRDEITPEAAARLREALPPATPAGEDS